MKITIIPFRSLLIIQLFSTLNCKPPEKNEESPIGELQNGGQEWVEEEWMSGEWMDEEWMDMLPNLESLERFEKHDKKEYRNRKSTPIGPVVLITGASNGIGFNLVQKLLEDPSVHVIFAADIQLSQQMAQLSSQFSPEKVQKNLVQKIVHYIHMDVISQTSIEYGVATVKQKLKEYARLFGKSRKALRLNTLINNAGVMETFDKNRGVHPLFPDHKTYMRHLEVNAVGAALITGHFLPLIPTRMRGRIVFISSTVGSIGDFQGVRSHKNVAYGMSKAAMNYYMKAISWYQKWLTMSICPGWVRTDIGSQVKSATHSPADPSAVATRLVEIIGAMDRETNGKFYSMHFEKWIKFR